ncbi:MAG TPA: DUF3592 domain-containing protein [Pirellulales bacterium]
MSKIFAVILIGMFAIGFSSAGVFLTWQSAHMLLRATAMRGWQEVPARILDAELIHDRDMLQAHTEYEYVFDGVAHRNHTISADVTTSESPGLYQQNIARLFKEHQTSGEPIPCYVNPRNPSEAVLFRDLRPGILGTLTLNALLFGTIGLSTLVLVIMAWLESRRTARYTQRALAEHSGEPWFARKDWANRRIESKPGSPLPILLVLSTIWNLIGTLSWFLVPAAITGTPGSYFAIGLILTGWLVAGLTWWVWRSRRWYVLTLAANPIVPGGHLRGQIETNVPADVLAGYIQELRCQAKVLDPDQGRSIDKTLWSARMEIPTTFPGPDFGTLAFPVEFAIPRDAPATGPGDESNQGIAWRLCLVDSAADGADNKPAAQFELPVFAVEQRPGNR